MVLNVLTMAIEFFFHIVVIVCNVFAAISLQAICSYLLVVLFFYIYLTKAF